MKFRLLLVVLFSLVLLAAVAGMRRVGPHEQAVRVGRDGSVTALPGGWHFVGPGSKLVKYPLGGWKTRVPSSGTATVTFSNGDTLGVAFECAILFPEKTAELLYQGFSTDFTPAFEKLVVAAAEIEAAALDDASKETELESAVYGRVVGEMSRFRAEVMGVSLVQWGSE